MCHPHHRMVLKGCKYGPPLSGSPTQPGIPPVSERDTNTVTIWQSLWERKFWDNSNLLELFTNYYVIFLNHSIDKFFDAILMTRTTQEDWDHFWPDRPTGTLRVEFNSFVQSLLLFRLRALFLRSIYNMQIHSPIKKNIQNNNNSRINSFKYNTHSLKRMLTINTCLPIALRNSSKLFWESNAYFPSTEK